MLSLRYMFSLLKFKINNLTFILHNFILLIMFTILYKEIIKKYGNDREKQQLSTYEDSLYFTCITHFGVGFGDITPETPIFRKLCIIHILLVFLVLLY
jgi:lipoprotein signal peptidase